MSNRLEEIKSFDWQDILDHPEAVEWMIAEIERLKKFEHKIWEMDCEMQQGIWLNKDEDEYIELKRKADALDFIIKKYLECGSDPVPSDYFWECLLDSGLDPEEWEALEEGDE